MSRIPVGGDLDLELRRLLFSIHDRAVRVCSLERSAMMITVGFRGMYIFVKFDSCAQLAMPRKDIYRPPTKLETKLIEFLRGIPVSRSEEFNGKI